MLTESCHKHIILYKLLFEWLDMFEYDTPEQLRKDIRKEIWTKPTSGLLRGFIQTNVVILPSIHASDFEQFCISNHKSCPIIEILKPGNPHPSTSAQQADIRTDIPRYNIYRNGEFEKESLNVTNLWENHFVTFLLGCSFSFEYALQNAGITIKHQQLEKNVAMYVTNIQTVTCQNFSGPMVVSMRPIATSKIQETIAITTLFPNNHGAPIHVGDPSIIGINDFEHPEYGDFTEVSPGETPVFWACGVTPQVIALNAKPSLMITHTPGHMFLTDLTA